MKKNIYEISGELRELFDIIEEAEGELTPEIEARLTIAQDEYEKKIMSYYAIIQERKGQTAVIKDEIDRLNRMAASNVKLEAKLKSVVMSAVNEFGYEGKTGNMKLDLETLKLWTVNKDKVVIEDEDTFNDPRFCSVALNLPSDMDFVHKVFKYASSISTDKDLLVELNGTMKANISRKRLKEALDLGKKVKGTTIVNNPFVVMR